MRLICAWCQKESENINESNSHSMCLKCMRENGFADEIILNKFEKNTLPTGKTIIDRQNRILSYESNNRGINTAIISRNYFSEIVPFLYVKDLRNKLGGLRRRKNDGYLEFLYIFRDQESHNLVHIGLFHHVDNGNTDIVLELIEQE